MSSVADLLIMLAFNISFRTYFRDKNPSITFGEYIDNDEEAKILCSDYLINVAEVMHKNPDETFTIFTDVGELRHFITNINADVRDALYDYSSDDPATSFHHTNPLAREDYAFNREEKEHFMSRRAAAKRTILGKIKSLTKKLAKLPSDDEKMYPYKTKPTFSEIDMAILSIIDSSFVFTNKNHLLYFAAKQVYKH